jgi:hypothetical protein
LCWFVLDSLLVCVTKQTPTSTTVTTRSIHPFVFVCVTTKQQQQLLLQQEQLTKLQRCRCRLVQSSIHPSNHLCYNKTTTTTTTTVTTRTTTAWCVDPSIHPSNCVTTNNNNNYCYNKNNNCLVRRSIDTSIQLWYNKQQQLLLLN